MKTTDVNSTEYDVLVVGTGHAGCEAALAAARAGCRTAVFTLNLDNVALMPCNPSVGGPGKGHLVREIDALGGEMARNTDATSIQVRQLNTSKGPAVQALRAQSDKRAYSQSMKGVLESQPNLDVKQALVDDLILTSDEGLPSVAGVVTSTGTRFHARTVILTTGTFLRGRIIVGDQSYPAGRAGEFPADNLSMSLARCDFRLGRLKTGTPPRIDGKTIDYSLTETQDGSEAPLFFSWDAREAYRAGRVSAPDSRSPIAEIGGERRQSEGPWREQLPCFQVQTNQATHDIIRRNLGRAPMYNGGITSVGPRYCPSIETKIVRFAEKSSHSLFLEPEGWRTREMYVQGANTSLPEDVQLQMLRTIPALRQCEIMRAGYAIEYDYLPGTQVYPTLEAKLVRNLFLAGQIIGTTGYEEAGALGIMAGINAAQRVLGRDPVVLRRDEAYIGVLIDDLVTKEMDEPYRMHTSQAEFRLLLRQDNADERLSPLGRAVGLIGEDRYREIVRRTQLLDDILARLGDTVLHPNGVTNEKVAASGAPPLTQSLRAKDFLSRPGGRLSVLQDLGLVAAEITEDVAREAETRLRYATYVSRQEAEVERLRRVEARVIPADIDYASVSGLRSESREKLERVRPRTIGQASRIAGVTPSDVAMLLVSLERDRRQPAVG
jgi:tRNA uridine 5-carboxymethylaminomethyl modification enzyme